MELRRFEWLLDFTFMFLVFVAVEALRKLHSAEPPLGVVLEGIFAGGIFSLLNYARRHHDSSQ